MSNTTLNDTLTTTTSEMADAVPLKLKAEDFSTADVDGVAHSAAGSGQMNYLMLQAKQTDGAQTVNESNLTLGESDIGNLSIADGQAHAGGWGIGSTVSELSSAGAGHGGALGAAQDAGSANLNGATAESRGSGVAVGSISASVSQGSTNVSEAYRNFDNQSQSQTETTDTTNTQVEGDTTVNNTTIETHQNTTIINNYPTDPEDDSGERGPLLNLDVDVLSGETLEPVQHAVTNVLDMVTSAPSEVQHILSTPAGDLPGELVATVDGTLGDAQAMVQELASDVLGGAVLDNVGTTVTTALDDLASGNLSLNSILDNTGLLNGTDVISHLEVRGLGPLDAPVGNLMAPVLDGVDGALHDLQVAAAPVLENLPLSDVASALNPVVTEVTQGISDALNEVAGTVVTPGLEAVQDLTEALQEPLAPVVDALGNLLEPLEEVVTPVQDVVNDLTLGLLGDDAAGSLLDGLGLTDSNADNDSHLDLGPLGINEEVTLNPVEGLLGDVDSSLDLDNLDNPGDLLELNLDALNGDTGEGVDVASTLGDLVDRAGDIVESMTGDGAGDMLDGILPTETPAVEDLLDNLDLDAGLLETLPDLDTDVVGDLLGSAGVPDTGEDVIGDIGTTLGGVLDNLNETVGDLLPPVAPVVETVTPVVNTVVEAAASLPVLPPVIAPVVANVPAPIPTVVNTVGGLLGGHSGGGLFGHH